MPHPPTIYANIVNIRTTPTELVIDFGCIIPATPEEAVNQPLSFEPEMRVIFSVAATRALGDILLKTAQQHEAASQPTAAQTAGDKK